MRKPSKKSASSAGRTLSDYGHTHPKRRRVSLKPSRAKTTRRRRVSLRPSRARK